MIYQQHESNWELWLSELHEKASAQVTCLVHLIIHISFNTATAHHVRLQAAPLPVLEFADMKQKPAWNGSLVFILHSAPSTSGRRTCLDSTAYGVTQHLTWVLKIILKVKSDHRSKFSNFKQLEGRSLKNIWASTEFEPVTFTKKNNSFHFP